MEFEFEFYSEDETMEFYEKELEKVTYRAETLQMYVENAFDRNSVDDAWEELFEMEKRMDELYCLLKLFPEYTSEFDFDFITEGELD